MNFIRDISQCFPSTLKTFQKKCHKSLKNKKFKKIILRKELPESIFTASQGKFGKTIAQHFPNPLSESEGRSRGKQRALFANMKL